MDYLESIIKGIFLLILAVAGNFVAETLGCKTQKLLSNNMYAKHVVLLTTIYFCINYTDNIEIRNKFRSLEYHWGPKAEIKFPNEDEFDCFRLNYMSDGEVLLFDKNNFLGYAEFNGKRIYRKIYIHDGIVTIEDYSEDVDLEEYTTWGEEKEGIKVKFSEGYKRLS